MTSFYLLTDTHYLSKQLWVEGKPFLHRIREDLIAINHTPEILDTYIDEIIADSDTDTVVFLGDNIDNGDMISHYEFRERLEKLKAAGKKVYMTYATHDYIGFEDDENNFQLPRRFTKDTTEQVPHMRRADLPAFYFDYTQKNAFSVEEESGSYCVILSDNVLLIAIIDNGNGRSYCGLSDRGFEWLENEIKAANDRGDYILTAVHHPVLPPWIIYEKKAFPNIFGGRDRFAEILCRNNVHVVFTGHTHVQSIKKFTDKNGNWFYAVATIALANVFGKMRRVDIDCESGLCAVTSVQADITKSIGKDRQTLYRQNFPGIWETLLPLAYKDYDEFLRQSEGYIKSEILKKYKPVIKFACRKLDKMTYYQVAGLAGIRKRLGKDKKAELKHLYIKDAAFEVLRHLFTGNAPFSPETDEYKIATALTKRIDRLNIKKLRSVFASMTMTEAIQEFLYNNRTGDDDSISFYLK